METKAVKRMRLNGGIVLNHSTLKREKGKDESGKEREKGKRYSSSSSARGDLLVYKC